MPAHVYSRSCKVDIVGCSCDQMVDWVVCQLCRALSSSLTTATKHANSVLIHHVHREGSSCGVTAVHQHTVAMTSLQQQAVDVSMQSHKRWV